MHVSLSQSQPNTKKKINFDFYPNFFSSFRPFNSQEALDKAKRNVEENYAVVGILEDLNKTFAVMEHYVPRFFRGISSIYHGQLLIIWIH